MNQHIKLLLLFTLTLYFSSCKPRQLSKAYDAPKVMRLYSESVGDAAKPQPWEITKDLVKIQSQNLDMVWKVFNGEQYILVSSWKETAKYYKNDKETGMYNTEGRVIWVTTVPELQELCKDKRFGRKEGLDMRLKQLLGLPPTTKQAYFVEFWVRPQDLFRPCLDGDIAEVDCNLDFPENVSEEHKTWINDLRLSSYYNPSWNGNYPWTQLGYTYDWNPKVKDHVGLSEFVIGKNKEIIVHKIYKTEEYCEIQ